MVRNYQKDWATLCPMVEFAINSNVSATMGFAPFELNYGYIPNLGQWLGTDTKFTGVHQFAQQALWNLMLAHDTIIESRIVQMHHANQQQTTDMTHSPGDLVYLLAK